MADSNPAAHSRERKTGLVLQVSYNHQDKVSDSADVCHSKWGDGPGKNLSPSAKRLPPGDDLAACVLQVGSRSGRRVSRAGFPMTPFRILSVLIVLACASNAQGQSLTVELRDGVVQIDARGVSLRDIM